MVKEDICNCFYSQFIDKLIMAVNLLALFINKILTKSMNIIFVIVKYDNNVLFFSTNTEIEVIKQLSFYHRKPSLCYMLKNV